MSTTEKIVIFVAIIQLAALIGWLRWCKSDLQNTRQRMCDMAFQFGATCGFIASTKGATPANYEEISEAVAAEAEKRLEQLQGRQ